MDKSSSSRKSVPGYIPTFAIEEFPTRGQFLKMVLLTPQYFGRGAKVKESSSGFLLDEALRFFNYGTPSDEKGAYLINKNFTSIKSDTLRQAIVEYGGEYQDYIYRHIEAIYGCLISEKTETGKPKWPDYKELLRKKDREIENIVKNKDNALKSFIVSRIICDGDDWASDEGKIMTIQFVKLDKLFSDIKKDLEEFDIFHKGQNKTYERILNIDSERNTEPDSELWNDLWVSSKRTLACTNNADLLQIFAHKKVGADVGLTEKIYATMTQLQKYASMMNSMNYKDDTDSLYLHTREYSQILDIEVTKLHNKPFGIERKKKEGLQLDKWLRDLEEMERQIIIMLKHLDIIPIDMSYCGIGIGPARSDLLWGLILTSYLRLFMVRIKVLALIAAIPFRLIYEGGAGNPAKPGNVKNGIVGLLGVSIWEYFTGFKHQHIFHEEARNCFPAITEYDENKWVKTSVETSKVSCALVTKKEPFNYDTKIEFRFGDINIQQDTKKVISVVEIPPKDEKEKPGPFQRIAAPSYARWQLDKNEIEEISVAKQPIKLKEEYFDKKYAKFNIFPPKGEFPIPITINPPILDLFFNLKESIIQGNKKICVFNKREGPYVSLLKYGAKITAQLQAYVVAWLYQKGIEESGIRKLIGELTSEIKFNSGNIQYGGKYPPHMTHRDGYGFDWGLYGKPEEGWRWAIQWPKDSKKKYMKEFKKTLTYSLGLMNRNKPISEIANIVRNKIIYSTIIKEEELINKSPEWIKKAKEDRKAIALNSLKFINPDYNENVVKKTAIPTETLIAQSIDEYNRNNIYCVPIRHYLFREFVRDSLFTKFSETQKLLRQRKSLDINNLKEHFRGLEEWCKWFPLFPDRSSHFAHHVAHLAVFLSLPIEVIWASPLYHFRALGAVSTTLLEEGFSEANYSLFGCNEKSSFSVNTQGEKDNSSTDMDTPTSVGNTEKIFKFWPLPVPRLKFLPDNHFDHWHVQYWMDNIRDFYGKNNKEILKKGINSHFDYISVCLPFWKILGVDFSPFIQYLDEYLNLLTKNSQAGATRQRGDLRKEIEELKILLEDAMKPNAYNLGWLSKEKSNDLRSKMFKKIIEYEEKAPFSLSNDQVSANKTTWPPLNSFVSEVIIKSEKIVKQLCLEYEKIKNYPESTLPSIISEALKSPSAEKTILLDADNDLAQEEENDAKDDGLVESLGCGKYGPDDFSRDSWGEPILTE